MYYNSVKLSHNGNTYFLTSEAEYSITISAFKDLYSVLIHLPKKDFKYKVKRFFNLCSSFYHIGVIYYTTSSDLNTIFKANLSYSIDNDDLYIGCHTFKPAYLIGVYNILKDQGVL